MDADLRVRSVTDTSMMFMMPMPRPERDRPIAASSIDITLVVDCRLGDLVLGADQASKSASPSLCASRRMPRISSFAVGMSDAE